MRIALVSTFKNEKPLLRLNLLYHHFLGVEKFYLFDDGADDGTVDSISDLPYIRVMKSVDASLFSDRPELERFTSQAHEQHTARQNLNTCTAIEMAPQENFDWLIALDADELLCPDRSISYVGQLVDFLAAIPEEFEVVRFPTLEVVSHQMEYENVFAQETLFKKLNTAINHRVFDPSSRRTFKIRGFLGQNMGKSAVKLITNIRPINVHKFVTLNGRELNRTWTGNLLHYYCYSYSDFIRKYRNFSKQLDTWESGNPIEYQRKVWRDLVNDPESTESDLRSYYQRWLLFDKAEILRLRLLGLLTLTPRLVEVNTVQSAFRELGINSKQ